ncbi:LysR family transcriptional regulator [Nocardiopsis ansamitocini]|uniref:LysR family transcriptional regulator n=1 Tax=Nocardiopsis ansamitocini TaxID=1670832 RepID=A0A9W6UIW2_9ACTN|nr:LysR family transcriptional regulator [Nocardiopsis ansamitocini]
MLRLMPTALVYFHEVARTGSVTEAAARHHIATSAVSRQIAKLESEVGASLFDRHTRGMTLTDAGHRLLAHVRRTEIETSALLTEIRSIDTTESRTVSVACTEGFSYRVVPQAMAALRRVHETVSFRLDVVTREEATRQVVEGQSDIAVTYAIGQQNDVRVEHSVVVPLFAMVRPDHPLAGRSSVGLAELCEHPLALSSEGTSQRELFDAAVRMERLTIRPVLECGRFAPIYEFAKAGGGVALASSLRAETAPSEGLVHVRVNHPVFEQRRAQVQTMAGRHQSTRVLDLVTILVSGMAPPDPPAGG